MSQSPSPSSSPKKASNIQEHFRIQSPYKRRGGYINPLNLKLAAETMISNGLQPKQRRSQAEKNQYILMVHNMHPNLTNNEISYALDSLNQGTTRNLQVFDGFSPFDLVSEAKQTQKAIEKEDFHIVHVRTFADQDNNFNINSRLSQASNDTANGSRPQISQIKERDKEKDYMEQDGIQSQKPFSILDANETDQAPQESLPEQEYEHQQQKEIQSKILISEVKEAEKPVQPLEYRYGGLDWGQEALSKAWQNKPHPVMKITHYFNNSRIPSLRTQKQVLYKGSKINRPKERKNYNKPSKLMQSIVAQDKLKKIQQKKQEEMKSFL
ncbi:MAG: hypothetical protein EZS28_011182 [Streblomastix strix]|uniref:Uncharacterized protein n=1 Tax=Streblomastix strix TaxID=222440 RepID=A0A5J4WFK5_9EUKA|nr:MAG: hypothetical protein EZS28_011182 [Streblomastix strix]